MLVRDTGKSKGAFLSNVSQPRLWHIFAQRFSPECLPLKVPRYDCPGMTVQRSGGIHLGLSSVPVSSVRAPILVIVTHTYHNSRPDPWEILVVACNLVLA